MQIVRGLTHVTLRCYGRVGAHALDEPAPRRLVDLVRPSGNTNGATLKHVRAALIAHSVKQKA